MPTPVSDTDTGSFLDAGSASTPVQDGDAGAFADAQVLTIRSADTGTLAWLTPKLRVSSADTGSGAEAGSSPITSHPVSDADTFSGTHEEALLVTEAGPAPQFPLIFQMPSPVTPAPGELGTGTEGQSVLAHVYGSETGLFTDSSNFPGGPPPAASSIIFEGFSVTRLGVLAPGTQAIDGTLYGVRSVQLSPQWVTTSSQADDWTVLVWNAPGKMTLSVTGGFLPWPILAELYGTAVSSSGAAPADYYALPLLAQRTGKTFSLVVELTGKDSLGRLRTIIGVLYRAQFGPVTFSGPAYKNGLEATFTAALALSSVDETGQRLTDRAYGRLDPVPAGAADWLPAQPQPAVPMFLVRDQEFARSAEFVIYAGSSLVPVSSTDTGAFTETVLYAGVTSVAKSSTDTGSFADAGTVVTGTPHAVSDTDAGVFTDAGTANGAFQVSGLTSGGFGNVLAQTPDGTRLAFGGDVEAFAESLDGALTWHQIVDGLDNFETQCAALDWSLLEPGVLYALTGESQAGGGSTGGGFMARPATGPWQRRSAAVMGAGNHAASPLPSGGWPRPTGRLIAQDVAHGLIYVATYGGGVARSADNGVTWTYIGFTGGTFFCRSLAYDAAHDTLYVAVQGQNPGVYKTASPRSASPSWTRLSGSPSHPEHLLLLDTGPVLYAAAGGRLAPSGGTYAITDGGLWCGGVGGASWTQLTGTFPDGTTGPDTAASYWNSVTGYIDGSGHHNVIGGCTTQLNPTGAATYNRNLVRAVCAADGSGTVLSWHDLTAYSTINSAALPDGRTWWREQEHTFSNWLGTNGYWQPFVLLDGTDASHQRMWCNGASGPFLSTDGGATWQVAVSQLPLFQAHFCAANPVNHNELALVDADWTSFYCSDARGTLPFFNAASTNRISAAHPHAHGVAFDPVSGDRYTANSDKFSATGGEVYYCAAGGNAYTATGFSSAAGGTAALGVYCGVDGSGNHFQLAASQGSGLWRKQGVGTAGTWSRVSTSMSSLGTAPAAQTLFFTGSGALIFAFDRLDGVYRSTDYGKTWAKIWSVTGKADAVGKLQLNPAVPNELWVSQDTGLYKLPAANAGTVGAGITAVKSSLPGTTASGPFIISAAGTIYAASMGSTGTVTQLWGSTSGGASWQPAANASFGRVCQLARCFALVTMPDGSNRLFVSMAGQVLAFGTPLV